MSTETFFQDRNCQDQSFTFKTEGLVTYDQHHLHHIDFTYLEVFLTLHKDLLVADFNSRQVCGISNWKINFAEKITGLKCNLFNFNSPTFIPKLGDRKFGIYLLKLNELIYGALSKDEDGNSPEKRPTKFNDSVIYKFNEKAL